MILQLSTSQVPTHVTNASDSKTALVYDLDMTLHKNMFTTHPERPKRVTEPMKLLEESKILSRVRTVCSREVTKEEVCVSVCLSTWVGNVPLFM